LVKSYDIAKTQNYILIEAHIIIKYLLNILSLFPGIEPNPFLVPFLKAYRSCDLFQYCIAAEPKKDNKFRYRDSETIAFSRDCATLEQIADSANLVDIDMLLIDVENQEKQVLEHFPFQKYRIKYIVMEVREKVG
jgi:hypothetical protein